LSEIPPNHRYTKEHEYLHVPGDPGIALVGITDYAQGELGDVVFVELPKVGARFKQGEVFGTIEAVKAVSELFTPASGEVLEVNPALEADPGAVNRDPYGAGWLVKLKLSNPADLQALLTPEQYRQHIGD
jgi:glycine cleavage system H protein